MGIDDATLERHRTPHSFNIYGLFDVCDFRICRPGSGPNPANEEE